MKNTILLALVVSLLVISCKKEENRSDYRCYPTLAGVKSTDPKGSGGAFYQFSYWDTLRSKTPSEISEYKKLRTSGDSIVQFHTNPDSFALYMRTCDCYDL